MEWGTAASIASNGSIASRAKEGGGEDERREAEALGVGGGDGVLYVKVMTDEQMELLRRQISAYATICEHLVEMHRAVTTQHDSLAGMRLGNLYCDPLTTGGHKLTARQRWTPTPVQLQILESIFEKGNGTPCKQRIKEITTELTQHGQISESNVYNWFQNRRARSKRKQTASLQNNAESEVEAEAEAESSNEKKAKSDKVRSNGSLHQGIDDQSFQSAENSSEMHFIDPEPIRTPSMYAVNESSRSSVSLGRMSFYENALSNPRADHYMGRMEFPGSFSHFRAGESYDMIG